MQVAAATPLYVRRQEIGEGEISAERAIYRNQALASGKPEPVVDKIVEGKLKKYYSEVCLHEQSFIKDSNLTVEDLIQSKIAILKENIKVARFARFKVGE